MPAIIFYLLKFSISLSVLYLFYQLVLRRLTFYNWNRWFLLVYSLLSFFIPFINISSIAENKNLDHIPVLHYLPMVENSAPVVISKSNIAANVHQPFNYWNLLLIIIAAGIFIMMVRLIIQFFSLLKIKRNAAAIENDDVRIYEVDKSIVPFSFGNAIFINPRLHTEKEFEEIILHEYVHVKQKHTVDILWSELICIINWYNPFAWLMRHSIRQNLEFIADDNVLKKGFDKKNYQHHLLKVIAQPQYRIANSFNISSLKKRIIMMNKLKSAKAHAIKFLFVLPLIALLLLAFRDKYKNDKQQASDGFEIKSKKPLSIFLATNHAFKNSNDVKILKKNKTNSDTIPGKSIRSQINWTDNVLYIIDGKEVGDAELGKIDPANIESITVLKDTSAIRAYGERAKNGVVVIRTKWQSPKSDTANSFSYKLNYALKLDKKDTGGAKVDSMLHISNVVINLNGKSTINQPIFFLDGKEISNSEMKKINLNSIESINVLKDSSATKFYGEKAKNGVILIKTKNAQSKTNTVSFSSQQQSNISQNKLEEKKQELLRDFERKHLLIDDSLRLWNSPYSANSLTDKQIETLIIERENAVSQLETDMKNLDPQIEKDGWMKNKIEGEELQNRLYRESYTIYHSLNSKTSYRNRKNNEYPITGKAERIVLDKEGVEIIGGSVTWEDEKTLFANGNIWMNNERDNLPLIVYNNKQISRSNNFKTIQSHYKIFSLDKEQAENKYGDKGKNGAVEISSL